MLFGTDGKSILATDEIANSEGLDLFAIWDGYRQLVTGEVDKVVTDMKIKVEDNSIAKFAAIPRPLGRGIIESGIASSIIAQDLQSFITQTNGILEMAIMDSMDTVLITNKAPGYSGKYKTSSNANTNGIKYYFDGTVGTSYDYSEERGTIQVHFPMKQKGWNGGQVRYLLFLELDANKYFSQMTGAITLTQLLLNSVGLAGNITIGILFLVIVGGMVFNGRFILGMIKPIEEITTDMVKMGDGDFSFSVKKDLMHRDDEFGDMMKASGLMMEKISHSLSSIKNSA